MIQSSLKFIHKILHSNSSEIIEITTWGYNSTILQVGKLITFNAKVTSSRYIDNVTNYEKIIIKFPHDLVNYWADNIDDGQVLHNELILTQNNSKKFRSDNGSINIKFAVPNNIQVNYCEYAQMKPASE